VLSSTLRLDLEEKIEKRKGEGDSWASATGQQLLWVPTTSSKLPRTHPFAAATAARGRPCGGQAVVLVLFFFCVGSRGASVFLFMRRFSLDFYFFALVHMRFLPISIRLLLTDEK
jgi:hypothetical protein